MQVAVKLIERSPDKLTRNVSYFRKLCKVPDIDGELTSDGLGTPQVEREIINHSVLLHPHIVRFKECFLTPHYLGIAMEYANGGDMYAYTKTWCVLKTWTSFFNKPLPATY